MTVTEAAAEKALAAAPLPEPPCPTIDRLAALKPGETFTYLSYPEGRLASAGPLCRALYERIHAFARGLELKGRVELVQRTRPGGNGHQRCAITDFIAVGRWQPRR